MPHSEGLTALLLCGLRLLVHPLRRAKQAKGFFWGLASIQVLTPSSFPSLET